MIVDSSALLAIIFAEPDERAYAAAIAAEVSPRISAATYAEAAIVADATRDPVTSRRFDQLVRETRLVIEPVTAVQAHRARAGYRDFGKGSGHPARLNFGDCFAYALATDRDEPLLFKGDDFGHTDVRRADVAG
jgi:ribonuclease VapC